MSELAGNHTEAAEPRTSVRETVVTAFYPRALAAADSARNRAQAGYAIASAIASSLVVAGAFTSIEDRGLWAQGFGMLALIIWVVTGILFLYAVATPVTPIEDLASDADSPEWVENILRRANSERVDVDQRNWLAIRATVVAVGVTVIAVVLTATSGLSLNKDEVTVSLTDAGKETVAELCTSVPAKVRGQLENRTLRREFVVVTVPPGGCHAGREATLRIRTAEISGIVSP